MATGGMSLNEVTVAFGGLTALEDVSVAVDSGEVVGVIGPNGAGKTTLFNVACGFVRPRSGHILWEGKPLSNHKPHQLASLGISRTLQGVGLWPRLTVLENVIAGLHVAAKADFGSALLGLPRSSRDERRLSQRARDALEKLGVAEWAGRLPGELPYGVQKRVSLARALAGEPRLLLLDEPASGL
ncbi:MAG TPA: ATP-binding cassette domain-containing protein, partial [Acidimicrobiales bacterium]|nr:ATP-binding cassette domain-containing protein [Acidimicrobiales bacterium]